MKRNISCFLIVLMIISAMHFCHFNVFGFQNEINTFSIPMPEPEPTAEPTEEPTEEATTEPTEEPTPEPEPEPTMPIFTYTTYAATDITESSATLNGYCDVERFENGVLADGYTSFLYWKKGDLQTLSAGGFFIYSSRSVSCTIYDLESGTTYEFTLDGSENVMEFTTVPINEPTEEPPEEATAEPTEEPTPEPEPEPSMPIFTYTTYAATDITESSATLNGYCDVERFENGVLADGYTSFLYWKKGDLQTLSAGGFFIYSSRSVSCTIYDLEPGTTYEFMLEGSENVMEFTTQTIETDTNKSLTITTEENGYYICTPLNVPIDSYIVLSCYSDNRLCYVNYIKYSGESNINIGFYENSDFSKVMVLESLESIIPVAPAETVKN